MAAQRHALHIILTKLSRAKSFSAYSASTNLEHPRGVAGAEDGVHVGVPPGLRRREVGREDAAGGAPPPQVLARGAPPRDTAPAAAVVLLVVSYFHIEAAGAGARGRRHENLAEIAKDPGERCC